jgi:CIC family chloride channel protein
MRPAIAGAFLGIIAIKFPHIIGVGMETTSGALSGTLLLREAIIFVIIKGIATAITMAGRMGGGVFGPAMMVGALSGLAFGIIATGFLPEVSGSHTLYALAGMGAVGAAILGAPISTTLIVFELTGDWQTGLAVMVAVSISTLISSRMVNHSFFLTQLENRGVHLAAGPQAYVLAMQSTTSIMRAAEATTDTERAQCEIMMDAGQYVIEHSTLEQALPMFDRLETPHIPVVRIDDEDGYVIVGILFHIDALKSYNRALSAVAAEEHS